MLGGCLLLAGCTASSSPAQLAPARQAPGPTTVLTAVTRLPTGARAVRLFVEPRDGKRVVSQAILRARRSIVLEMYLLTDRVLIHDLEHAAAKGVALRVILERQPYGSVSNNPENVYAYDNLMAADIPTRWSSPAFA